MEAETTSNLQALPHVLYVGLQKTGSTFLRHYFYQHPGIDCTRHGALLQTSACDVAARGEAAARASYAARFGPPDGRLRIDMYESLAMGYLLRREDAWEAGRFVTPLPSARDDAVRFDPEALVTRVRAILPDARIVLTVRSQLDWLDSSFRHFRVHLPAGRQRFVDFLETLEGRFALEVAHLDRTFAHWAQGFGAGRVHLLPLEELERDEPGALARLCAFLGVEAVPYEPERKQWNRGAQMPAPPFPAAAWWRRWLPGALRQAEPSAATIPVELRAALCAAYSVGNARLQERVGVDLAQLGYP